MKPNRTIRLFFYLFSILILLFVGYRILRNINSFNLSQIDYRNDIEWIQRRFPYFNNSTKIYWKSGEYGSGIIGPSDFWVKGFIVLEEMDLINLQSDFDWHKVEILFEDGMNPNFMGFNSFEWYTSKELNDILYTEYYYFGDFYIDEENSLLYFDLSTY